MFLAADLDAAARGPEEADQVLEESRLPEPEPPSMARISPSRTENEIRRGPAVPR